MPRATVNGIDMHYEESGEGTPLLLVHGLGTGSADWEYQVPALAAKYRVIAPSLRGFGLSEVPSGPYSISLYAADMRALLDHLGIDRCHVCGISMGGAVGFQFAIDYPDRLLSLAIISSQPSFVLNTMRKRFMMKSRVLLARLLGIERESAIMRRWNFPGRQHRELRKRLAGRFKTTLAAYLDGIAAISGWTVEDQLDQIEVPVLYLAGDQDYTSPAEKTGFVDKMKDARLVVIPGARHAIHLERPDEVNDVVISFLAEMDQRQLASTDAPISTD